jgi:hypothetical protein
MNGRAPIGQLLMSAGEWTYSPVNPIRERSVSFLYLAKGGQALRILGNLFENTTVASRPGFNTNSLFMLELGDWGLEADTIRLQLQCLGSMYVIAANGTDPCRHSTVVLRRHGMHLLGDGNTAYEPVSGVYRDRWRELEKSLFALSCKNARVSAALKECQN